MIRIQETSFRGPAVAPLPAANSLVLTAAT